MRGQGYHWFKPAKRFDEEAYVIFSDTENPMAQKVISAVSDYKQQALVDRQELSNTLRMLAIAERAKETNYIAAKIAFIDSTGQTGFAQRAKTLLAQHSAGSRDAISALFNLFLQTETELAMLMKEGPNPLKNSGYSRGFDNYLKQYLRQVTVAIERGDKGYRNGAEFISGNLTFAQIVDRYIDEIFGTDVPTHLASTAEEYRNKIITAYTQHPLVGQFFQKHMNRSITPSTIGKVLKDKSTKTKRGGERTLRSQIDNIFSKDLLRGLDLEMRIAGGRPTSITSVHTGGINLKTDNVILDTLSQTRTIDIDLESIWPDNATIRQDLSSGLPQLQQRVKETYNDLFAMSVSAKDYRSNRDFAISSSSFKNSAARIEALFPGNSFIEKLSFYLNNSVPGAALEDSRDEILDNIAHLAAAYMFDDIENMFKASGQDGLLHLYNINGTYHALSELLMGASNDVMAIDPTNLAIVSYSFGNDVIEETNARYLAHDGSYPIGGDASLEWARVRSIVEDTPLDIRLRREAILGATNNIRTLLQNSK